MASAHDICTHINFGVRGDELLPDEISRLLNLQPTAQYQRGEAYLGKIKIGDRLDVVERKRPFGVWRYDTSNFITSNDLSEHATFLLHKLEPVIDNIQELKNSSQFNVIMIFWHVGPAGFAFESTILSRLASLCNEMSFTCWETEEADHGSGMS